jgi:predicted nucleic acid-binding protein
MKRLFDASSIVNLMVKRGSSALDLVKGGHILDLTLYEVGNALWKLQREKKLTAEEVRHLMGTVSRLTHWVEIVSASKLDLAEVMKRAVESEITFYDASYVVAAKLKGATLITDDAKLARAASPEVEVQNSRDL